VAVTSFALGFSVLARNVKNKLFIAFAAICTAVSLWAFFFFFDRIWPEKTFYRWHLVMNVWLAPVGLAFIQVMVRVQDRVSRRLVELSVLAAMALTVALVFHFDSDPWVRQLVYFSPALIVVQTLHLMWIDRRLRRGIKRLPKLPTVGLGRRNLIYLGGLLVLGTSVMDHVPFMGRVIPAIGNILLTIYFFFISQAISQQRLLNFGALFSRFLVLMAVALTLTGVYSVLVAWIENSPGLFFLNSFIASFLILTLLDPLRRAVGYFTERLLTQKHRRLTHTLREAQRRLTGILDAGSLFQAVLLTVEQTLRPEWAALFVLKSDGTKFRRARITGVEPVSSAAPDAAPLREMLANHSLLQYCERLQRRGELPILLDQMLENEIDRSASRVQREFYAGLLQGLKALGSNLLIPLFDSGQILGFVTLYAPSPPEPWGNNWGLLQIVYPYFEQAAHTLRNMEVYAQSREKERLAALGEMAAGLAHEIRNPLGAIKGAAQYLDPSADRPESRFLRVIVEEVDRLNRVVTQFLDYSKPYAVDLRAVDVSSLAEKTLELLKPGLPAGVRLEFAGARAPARAMAAPEQLQQVLINLVQNSVRALDGRPEGRIRVAVEVDGQGRHREVSMAVEDDGPGIRREHLEKLFIPFFTTSPSGTGLGLSICQKIVEAHRGRIDVSSEEGRYARFTVTLPYAQPQV
jgi:signal transduction histidine kinase